VSDRSDRVELQLPADDAKVSLARLLVVTAARRAGMDAERLEDLRLVISEAATNAVLSHQRVQCVEPISIVAEVSEEAFVVVVTDCGPGFEPPEPEPVHSRDWSVEGGLGLTLMRALADEAEFERGDGMRVRLRFALTERVA
jgi:anti-sigma regulatory factor (Ser/Thr protein kinase)